MKRAYIVVDVAFGDSGKGLETARLTKKHSATLNVRFNGGAQASHNVVRSDFRHHAFRQYGSGTLHGAQTYLGEHVRFDPFMYSTETAELKRLCALPTFYVHPAALVVTPLHMWVSTSLSVVHKRGTCGMGVGVSARHAASYPDEAIRAGELWAPPYGKLKLFADRYDINISDDNLHNIADELCKAAKGIIVSMPDEVLRMHENVVFEGAQGALLDVERGFKPYVTSSDTSITHALEMIPRNTLVEVAGVMRMYMTRHGVGPLPTETSFIGIKEAHNRDGMQFLQGKWRTGWLDLELIQRGIEIAGGVNYLAVSHMDLWNAQFKVAGERKNPLSVPRNYMLFDTEKQYIEAIEFSTRVPVRVLGRGRRAEDREEI